MNESAEISLCIDGPGPQGKAHLSDFARVLDVLHKTIRQFCRCIANDANVTYEVTELRIGSGFVTVAPPRQDARWPTLVQVATVLDETLQAISTGAPVDSRIDYPALKATLGFVSTVEKSGVTLKVASVVLTRTWATALRELLSPDIRCHGSVSGKLEKLSVHGKHTFTLFPPILNESVECEFDESRLKDVLLLVGQTVTVYGQLQYSRMKVFPVRVIGEIFEPHPSDEALPSLVGLCGAVSDQASLSSVELIRSERDEWE